MRTHSENNGLALADPAIAEMGWAGFAERAGNAKNQKIQSFQCFHTGTTTSVKKSTIRRTRLGHNHVLVIETDSKQCFLVISKAEGCDEAKISDPNFIGWVRRYEGMCFARTTWEHIDESVDQFFQDIICSNEVVASTGASCILLDDKTCQDHYSWRELLMRPRRNDKDEWSYVYTTFIDGEEFTLINKGVKYLQTGLLMSWNPPRAKNIRADQKLDVRWTWFEGDDLHFCDENDIEYSTAELRTEIRLFVLLFSKNSR